MSTRVGARAGDRGDGRSRSACSRSRCRRSSASAIRTCRRCARAWVTGSRDGGRRADSRCFRFSSGRERRRSSCRSPSRWRRTGSSARRARCSPGRSVFRSGLDMFVVGLGVAVVGYFVGEKVARHDRMSARSVTDLTATSRDVERRRARTAMSASALARVEHATRLWILAWSATFAAPTVSRAQVEPSGGAIAIGYGALIVTAAHAARARARKRRSSCWVAGPSPSRQWRVEGRVLSVSADSLVVETPSGARALADADVRELRVSVGPRSRWAQGFLFGLGVGAGAGAAFGFADGERPARESSCPRRRRKGLAGRRLFRDPRIDGRDRSSVTATPREAWAHGRRPVTGVSLQVAPVVGPRVGIAGQLRF